MFSANIQQKSETIKVCIRMRPLLSHEDFEFWYVDQSENTISSLNSQDTIQSSKSQDLLSLPINKSLMDSVYVAQSFHFDKIYPKDSSSETIYTEMCRDITKSALNGINGSIFTYGQTTSGKTYTMLGTLKAPGILPCVLKDVFDLINNNNKNHNPNTSNNISYRIFCTYVEIYNEGIHDLLTDANSLKLIDDNKYGVIVSGAKRVEIKSFEEGIKLKDYGEENRKYRDTLINEYSSRSHTIFQLFIERYTFKVGENETLLNNRNSTLNLVDLAGSEKLNESESSSGETGYINKSLFALANVINKLAQGKKTHIPYRDSKLTRLLSTALGGNSLITIVCNVSPSAANYFQTLSTLRFASRAKVVKLKPSINEFIEEREVIERYRNEIRKLQKEITESNKDNDGGDDKSDDGNKENEEEVDYKMKYYNEVLNNKRLKIENEKLKKQTEDMLTFVNKYYTNKSDNSKGNNININNNNCNEDKDSNFLTPYIDMISSEISNSNHKNAEYYIISLNQINKEYQNQLKTLQQFYLSKIEQFQSNLPLMNVENEISTIRTTVKEDFSPEQISPAIFETIPLIFNEQSTIKDIKLEYEKKVDQLENIMTKYKKMVGDYYNRVAQNIQNYSQMNSTDEASNAMEYIKTEYTQCNNYLNELYEDKQGVLEKNFFDTLRKITSFKKE